MRLTLFLALLVGLSACQETVTRDVRKPLVMDTRSTGETSTLAESGVSGEATQRFVGNRQAAGQEVVWEYRAVDQADLGGRGGGLASLESGLNQWGAQGWELVQVAGATYIFKRASW